MRSKRVFPKRKVIKKRLYKILFESNNRPGRIFDVILLITILLSVITVILESVPAIGSLYKLQFYIVEWIFTGLFTIEYGLRIFAAKKPRKYIFSIMGFIDLVSIIPTYLGLFFTGEHVLVVIRVLRLLRIFKIFQLWQYIETSSIMIDAVIASRFKLTIFLGTVFFIAVIMGTVMFLIEGAKNGFDSIPRGIYWAVVTITTVGYGDIHPATPLGQFVAMMLMLLGYGIIALPTGIISAEIASRKVKKSIIKICSKCSRSEREPRSVYCRFCGHLLLPLKK